MRPVVRGDVPKDENDDPVEYDDYKDARDDLIDRMGDFCSYCEVALHSQVDVEHVVPKSLDADLELKWTNFLLACTNCNSIKSNKAVVLNQFYWPEQDNTLRAFFYEQDQPPQIVEDDDDVDTDQAQRTLDLTGINRDPTHPRFSDRDRRWLKRMNAWSLAEQARTWIGENDSGQIRSMAVELAKGIGFWSVWFTVFKDDTDMRRRLIDGFPGTETLCFADDMTLEPRPGGSI